MNNFIHMNYSKFQKVNWKAYWTDSKCLLIDEKLYDNILKINLKMFQILPYV